MKLALTSCALVALLAGCAVNPDLVATGPRFDQLHVRSDKFQVNEVMCRGLFESGDVCLEKAREICQDGLVERLDASRFDTGAVGSGNDRSVLFFRCGSAVAQAPAIVAQPVAPVLSDPAPLRSVARMQVNGDALFAYDRSDLTGITSGGKERLRSVAQKLIGMAPDEIRIAGYTDRIGTDEYNKALSARRAASIADYLRSQGVEAPMVAEGFGKKMPGVACPDEKGEKLIACLAPDRVVVIEGLVRDGGAHVEYKK